MTIVVSKYFRSACQLLLHPCNSGEWRNYENLFHRNGNMLMRDKNGGGGILPGFWERLFFSPSDGMSLWQTGTPKIIPSPSRDIVLYLQLVKPVLHNNAAWSSQAEGTINRCYVRCEQMTSIPGCYSSTKEIKSKLSHFPRLTTIFLRGGE